MLKKKCIKEAAEDQRNEITEWKKKFSTLREMLLAFSSRDTGFNIIVISFEVLMIDCEEKIPRISKAFAFALKKKWYAFRKKAYIRIENLIKTSIGE